MAMRKWVVGGLVAVASMAFVGCEQLGPQLQNIASSAAEPAKEQTAQKAALGTDTIVAGLKETLAVATKNAVGKASQPGAYASNPKLRIPMPDQLKGMAATMRKFGMGPLVDDLEAKMNAGAEQAAGQAGPVFLDAIRQMNFDDAKKVLNGGNTAATNYFREKTSADLKELCKPVVTKSIDQAGASAIYKTVMDKYSQLPLATKPQFSLEDYVSDKAVTGLFTLLGEEETKIRKDPAARTTQLLKTLFESAAKGSPSAK